MSLTDLNGSRRSRMIASSEIRELLRLTQGSEIISLAGGLPDPDLFPTEAIARASATVALDPGRFQYGPTEGDDRLREWIAERHTRRTGYPTDANQVIVTAGSQQALDLVARVLADAGDLVAVDDPGYIGALQAFCGAELELAGIPVDAGGLDVDHLAYRLANGMAPQFVYTVPTFQNPTGTTLSAERRRALGELAEHHGFVLVEDDPYDELSFAGSAPPPLGAFTDRVVSIGSFSKTIAPGLRVGWLIAPPTLAPVLSKAKQALDLHTSSVGQAIVAELVTTPGWFVAHIDHVAAIYHQRAATLHGALVGRWGDTIDCAPAEGGMFLWATLPEGAGVDTRTLLAPALAENVAFVPGGAFAVERELGSSMRLSFATVSEADLVEGADRLARVVTQELWSPTVDERPALVIPGVDEVEDTSLVSVDERLVYADEARAVKLPRPEAL
ncbi:MAG: PLP-dependent aminotransferase family protein [Acidimicrobiales bacterium]|nr:PLP-dependent aminotransferase family protein [Acidimicrobiales bacterium]